MARSVKRKSSLGKGPATEDPVRRWLRAEGKADHVVEAGLSGLLDAWERVARDLEQGYRLGLDDWLDDMDGRQILEGALAAATARERPAARERLAALDARVRARLVPAGRCLWGARVARERGFTADTNWWYFEHPAEPGPELRDDLRSAR